MYDQSKERELKSGHEVHHDLVQGSVGFGAQETVNSNFVQKWLLCSLDVGKELLLEFGNSGGVNFVKEAPDTAVDDGDLVFDGHGDILTLLEKLSKPHTSVQQLLGGSIKIRTELGEGSDLELQVKTPISKGCLNY